jgi:hypothetical protein
MIKNLPHKVNTDAVGIKVRTEGSLKNNLTFWMPMHFVRPRCENSKYTDMPIFRALPAGRLKAQNCELNFFVNPTDPSMLLRLDRSK